MAAAGGTKRLPRAVREQQMLDAAVQMFSANGYHETSMDAIAAKAQISKPMLYLYYGSKEELFGACLSRELTRFIEAIRADADIKGALRQSPREVLRSTIGSVLNYIDANRASWMARLLETGTRNPLPDTDFHMMAVALVGAGEAVATRVSAGDADVDDAAELLINLFWRGLKGTSAEKDATSAR